MTFDPNDYRKRVLAGIEARGGVQASDPFEWYDLPLDDVRDAAVAAQVEAVWGLWQKSRDSPKYRGLVTALLEAHRTTGPLVLERSSRRRLADQVRQVRQERDVDRSGPLDQAVARLVERFGGVPSSKLAGLRQLGLASGLDAAAVDERLRRVPVLETRTAPPALVVPADVRRQVRADLDELGRLLGDEPFASLHGLLGLEPGASRDEVRAARDAAAARNRELRPDRRRALVDDLLAAVTRLLVDGDPDAYLDAVADDVRDRLRPRLAAVLLVEDALTPAGSAALLAEARSAGLDPARASRVLAALAAEVGAQLPPAASAPARTSLSGSRTPAPVRPAPAPTPSPTRSPAPAPEVDLTAARAALTAGRVLQAQRLLEQAHQRAGRTPALRALADDVRAAVDEAGRTWRLVEQALDRRRFSEALTALDRLVRTAVDLPSPTGRTAAQALELARAGLHAASGALQAAARLHGADRERAVLQAAREYPDAEGVLAAVAALEVGAPTDVTATRVPGGVLVRWRASASTGEVDYRVARLDADGGRRTIGSTRSTELEDGAPVTGPSVPVYVVVARRAQQLSRESRSDEPAVRSAPQPVGSLTAAAAPGGSVRLSYDPPPSGRAQVLRLPAELPPPAPGTVLQDVEALGRPVPGTGAGVVVDELGPGSAAGYVVVTLDGATAVAGAAVVVADPAPVRGLRATGDLLSWEWPPGCTEALVVWRTDAPPAGPDDPRAQRRKTTNTRYELDGGAPLPPERPLHLAVHACVRVRGALVPALSAPPDAQLRLGAADGPGTVAHRH